MEMTVYAICLARFIALWYRAFYEPQFAINRHDMMWKFSLCWLEGFNDLCIGSLHLSGARFYNQSKWPQLTTNKNNDLWWISPVYRDYLCKLCLIHRLRYISPLSWVVGVCG